MDALENAITWKEELEALMRFRRALRKSDQDLLDELLLLAEKTLPSDPGSRSSMLPLSAYCIAIELSLFRLLRNVEAFLQEQESILNPEDPPHEILQPVTDPARVHFEAMRRREKIPETKYEPFTD